MKKVINKNAYRFYSIRDKFLAGVVLTGAEAKAIRTTGVDLRNAFVKVTNGEVYLINAIISPYKYARSDDYDFGRTRKLLLKEKEIKKLLTAIKNKLTIVPLACYTKGRWIKVEIGSGQKKTKKQRKNDIIERQIDRKLSQGMSKI